MGKKPHGIGFPLSAAAGFLAVFLFRRNLAAEASMVNYFGLLPPEVARGPVSVEQIRAVFSRPLAGLVYFDFFDVINVALVTLMFVPVLISVYRRARFSAVSGAFVLLVCGILYVLSNTAVRFLHNLNDGQVLAQILDNMNRYEVLGNIALFLFYFFGLYITITLRRVKIFSRYTFVFGLLTNIIGLLYFPLLFLGSGFDYLAIVLAAPFTVIWHMNIALHLLKERTKT